MISVFSQDVLGRWVYPIVPDNSLSATSPHNYIYRRHNIYLASDVSLAR